MEPSDEALLAKKLSIQVERLVDLARDNRRQLVTCASGWSADQLMQADVISCRVDVGRRCGRVAPVLTRLGRMIQPIHSALIREATNPGS
jgi:hypothetical protein